MGKPSNTGHDCATHASFNVGSFSKGCNSSFIALILKVSNATLVTDFHPISLIGFQYKIVAKILANRLSLVIGSCISPVQYAFIKGRSILDGSLILNEVIEWYRKCKKPLMIFKVDFEKAFDSVRWDFLALVMAKLGFGIRWCNWIKGCLQHARSSVLVNGSPTVGFEISRGLRQGDPLSPFLFILAMEGLNALICKALHCGEWSRLNAQNLICILRCFYLVSGLKINVHKSNILGIGVSEEDISVMANDIGCGSSKLPMKYLGVPVGSNMARCANWDVIINKFSSKLSQWKARLISVGGRLSLIKSVLSSLPTYFMSLYKDLGGLGIGSISALNAGLLFKWVWRFMQNSDELWSSVVKAIYGCSGGIQADITHSSNHSTWCGILSKVSSLKTKGIDLLSLCTRKLGNGAAIRFWDDVWCANTPLKTSFPRVHMLDTDKGCFVVNRISNPDWTSLLRRSPRGGIEANQFSSLQNLIKDVKLSDHRDTWTWIPDIAKGFSVASVRQLIDSCLSVRNPQAMLDSSIPHKSIIFVVEDVETVNHLFFSCDLAKDLWSLLARWWGLDIPVCSTILDWYAWLDELVISSKARVFLEALGVGRYSYVVYLGFYVMVSIFCNPPPKKALLWDSIVSQSFLWISSRNPKCKISWIGWLQNPIACIASV
ncbi:RNA-directed DNA polymerase, eukaryota, reverse transcriptase zinc-binding domain protein [Tanacetum coccineum]